jgi:hypothetical protein
MLGEARLADTDDRGSISQHSTFLGSTSGASMRSEI